jgi:hypothetical protein
MRGTTWFWRLLGSWMHGYTPSTWRWDGTYYILWIGRMALRSYSSLAVLCGVVRICMHNIPSTPPLSARNRDQCTRLFMPGSEWAEMCRSGAWGVSCNRWLYRERADGSFAGRMSSRVLGLASIGRRRQHSNSDILHQSRCQTSCNHERRSRAAVALSLALLFTLGRVGACEQPARPHHAA